MLQSRVREDALFVTFIGVIIVVGAGGFLWPFAVSFIETGNLYYERWLYGLVILAFLVVVAGAALMLWSIRQLLAARTRQLD